MKKLFRAGPAGASLAAVLILSAGIAAGGKDSDDAPGISVSPISGLVTSEDGGTATFTVVLNSEPTDEVTIDLVSSDASEGTVRPASLSFTPSDWDLPQTVTVTGLDDDADDGDVRYKIVTTPAASGDCSYDGLDAADISVLNTDNDGDSTDDELRITRVSVGLPGGEAHADSNLPSISADGRFVAFCWSGIYREGDTGAYVPVHPRGIFVHDRETGLIERVSVESHTRKQLDGWCSWPSISADGRFVAFEVEHWGVTCDVFVHDRETSLTEKVSVDSEGVDANGVSWHPAISADGRFATFYSSASNLVPGDTNGTWDIFVHDRKTGLTERASVADSTGEQANRESLTAAISADGRFVAFGSAASNLVVDGNGHGHVFVRDRGTGRTERVSVSSSGVPGGDSSNPSISADGRVVAFVSGASKLVPGQDTRNHRDIFVRDREAGVTKRLTWAVRGWMVSNIWAPSISADGRFVVFAFKPLGAARSDGTNIFIHDRQTGKTARLTAVSSEGQARVDCLPSLSADGRFVAFTRYRKDTFTGFGLMNDIFVARNPLAP